MSEKQKSTLSGSDLIIMVGQKFMPSKPGRPGFNMDDEQRKYWYKYAYYNMQENDILFDLGGDPKKGMLIIGDIGVGKTLMMRVMQSLFKDTERSFKWTSSMEFKYMMEDGMTASEILELYGKNYKGDILIDDIGVGQVNTNTYGNLTNIIAEILWERSELYVSTGIKTHLTSNLKTSVKDSDEKTLKKMYGDRVLDRLVEMNNLIIWEGKSLRGQKI